MPNHYVNGKQLRQKRNRPNRAVQKHFVTISDHLQQCTSAVLRLSAHFMYSVLWLFHLHEQQKPNQRYQQSTIHNTRTGQTDWLGTNTNRFYERAGPTRRRPLVQHSTYMMTRHVIQWHHQLTRRLLKRIWCPQSTTMKSHDKLIQPPLQFILRHAHQQLKHTASPSAKVL